MRDYFFLFKKKKELTGFIVLPVREKPLCEVISFPNVILPYNLLLEDYIFHPLSLHILLEGLCTSA